MKSVQNNVYKNTSKVNISKLISKDLSFNFKI